MPEGTVCQGRILVLEQEQWVREFLSSVIKLCGYEGLKLVNSVAEALDALEQCPYDLIITDPKQLHYQKFLDQVSRRHPGTRFIIMVQQRAQTQHLVYYEQVDIIFKPLSLDETVRKIRHAMHQTQLHQAEEDFRRLKQEALRLFLS